MEQDNKKLIEEAGKAEIDFEDTNHQISQLEGSIREEAKEIPPCEIKLKQNLQYL